jgi:hypothetical protein
MSLDDIKIAAGAADDKTTGASSHTVTGLHDHEQHEK